VKAVFGLGNPGLPYALSRHNVGFQVIDRFREEHRIRTPARAVCSALVYCDGDLLLVKPMTYMNESGVAVAGVLARWSIPLRDALVVYDDLDLPLGRMRILAAGGAGSHNGMRSVIGALRTEEIPRLRIGIEVEGRIEAGRDFVLGRFTPDEWEAIQPAYARAVDAVDRFRTDDIDALMTRFNRRSDAVVDRP